VVRQTFAAVAFVALGFARDPGGCGGVDTPNGGPNAPCTRSSDCGGKLVCLEGVCREPDRGVRDAETESSASTPEDAGHDGG
jgi:hypothetical protein